MQELFAMGPPVYWVVGAGLNYTKPDDQNMMCGGQGCSNQSIVTQLNTASKYPGM